jgi:DNA repair exonuclease SbcCD ATPase subunit
LLHGPNEAGKSTLAEAIHCALFLKARGTTSLHSKMQSDFGGDPEVRLEFDAAGRRHTLTKRFGSRGNSTLESEGHATLNGDDAEDALARLLGVDGTVSGGGIEGKMQKRWAHLWVWQGQSNQSPVETISESNDQLREKLQASSGQAITSSLKDAEVIQKLQALVDTTLTTTGRPKSGSDLAKAEANLAAAQAALVEKQTVLEQLNQSAQSYEQASADQVRYAESLEQARARLSAIDDQLVTVRQHRESLKDKSREREELSKDLERLCKRDAEIRKLTADLEDAQQAATPGATEVKRLETESRENKASLDQAIEAREAAAKAVAQNRNLHDAHQAQVNALQTSAYIAKLEKQAAKVSALKKDAQSVRKQLAPLSSFTAKAINALRKQSSSVIEAQARLDAYALELEVIDSDQSISIEGTTLVKGESKTLDHSAELLIGEGTRIRIRPGGADDLQNAQDAARKTRELLAKALSKLTVDSLDEGETKLQERNALESKLETLEEKLEEQDADDIESQLDEAGQSLASYKAQRDSLADKVGSLQFSDVLKTAIIEQNNAHTSLLKAEQSEQQAQSEEKATRRKHELTEKALNAARAKHQTAQDQTRELAGQLKFAVESIGDTETRAQSILTLEGRYNLASAAVKQETEALKQLGAEQLELDQQRLNNALTQDTQNLANAEERKTIARTELKSNGSTDPERECKECEAKVEQLQRRHAALRHQADVRHHLLERLKAARKATTEALARPLEDKVRPYLQLLFGGSSAKLHWAEDGSRLESFELDRSHNKGGVHTFDSLSHGTREQVALALRLAMAELLASDHNNCLPVILDDAFTHADKDRLEKLKSLLFQASQSGLQILLLSCHPENYGGLGASEVAL